jgi:hypothetical protein
MSEKTNKGRPENFNVQSLVDDLNGTCKTIDDFLPDGMTEEDLTKEDLKYIGWKIFRCETCHWWCESNEQDKNGNCNDCSQKEQE